MAAKTEKQVATLTENLPELSRSMRLFSLSMRSLYAEKSVGGSSEEAQDFRKLRDDTRNDAVAYLKGVMPVTTDCVRAIGDYFEYYEGLDFEDWKESLDDIIEEAETHKQSCLTLVKMHEAVMVPLKKRQDKAKVMVKKMVNLEKEYQEEVERLKADAEQSSWWAIALAFIPIVGSIASPLLGASANSALANAVAKKEQGKIILEAIHVTSDTLIPALGHFIDGLKVIAGFFEVIQQELTSFKEKGEKAKENPKKLHYTMMRKKAVEIKGGCRGFYATLPDVRTDFAAIPIEGTDQNYVDQWLEKQKQIIAANCRATLAGRLLKAITG